MNGHTGQLSSVSVLLSWAGSLGLTFETLQVQTTLSDLTAEVSLFVMSISLFLKERESFSSTASHILSTCLSCVLMAQIYCSRSRTHILKNRSRSTFCSRGMANSSLYGFTSVLKCVRMLKTQTESCVKAICVLRVMHAQAPPTSCPVLPSNT